MLGPRDLAAYHELHVRIGRGVYEQVLDHAVRRSGAAGAPPVPPAVAGLLFQLVHVARPKRLLEIGTGCGYSAALMALASPATHVVTFERHTPHAVAAEELFRAVDVTRQVGLRQGDFLELADWRVSGPIDFAFLDAAKTEYMQCLDAILPHLSASAMLVADDVFFTGEMPDHVLPESERTRIAQSLVDFRQRLLTATELVTTLLPLGAGVSVSIRVAPLTASGIDQPAPPLHPPAVP
jgi:predicted O-methyltransferase YrrM